MKSRRVARKGKEEVKTRRKRKGTEEEEIRGAGSPNTVKGNRAGAVGRGGSMSLPGTRKGGEGAPNHCRPSPPRTAPPSMAAMRDSSGPWSRQSPRFASPRQASRYTRLALSHASLKCSCQAHFKRDISVHWCTLSG